MLDTPAARFRFVAIAEALSWTGLLTGMFFKYVVVKNPIGVQVFGPIHGVIFLAYVGMAFVVAKPLAWTGRLRLLALAASIPPFGSIVFERWVTRRRADSTKSFERERAEHSTPTA